MKKFLSVLLLFLVVGVLFSCNKNVNEKELPKFPLTPDDGFDSWLHDNEEFDLEWYVDVSSFSWNSYGGDTVSRIIKEKTGAKIKFTTPVTDDGSKLSTLIAGNKLPDLVSVRAWDDVYSRLANQGYLYPLNDLMNNWAPSFNHRKQEDVFSWFEQADSKTYGLPNFAYSSKYMPKDEQTEPNSCILVREDYFNDIKTNTSFDMTTKQGFIDACKYIKGKYSQISYPVLMQNFELDGNASINLLAQYFCTPFENTDGSYHYRPTDPKFKEAVEFLNTLRKEGVLIDANLGMNYENIRTAIAQARAFVTLVTPQDFQMAFQSLYNQSPSIRYIPLVLRNQNGDDPVLQDVRGMGYLLTTVPKNCKRPDKVIKLLDYLNSEEGQRLVAFGEEGVTWNWTDSTKTKLEWTPQYLEDFNNNNTGQYGLYQMSLQMNLAYINKLKPENGKKPVDVYIENLKRPMTPYSYDYTASFLKHDVFFPNYTQTQNRATRVNSFFAQQYPKMIKAADKTAFDKIWDDTLNMAINNSSYLLNDVIALNCSSYQRAKNSLGLIMAWPQHLPGYVPPVTGPNGDFGYWKYLRPIWEV